MAISRTQFTRLFDTIQNAAAVLGKRVNMRHAQAPPADVCRFTFAHLAFCAATILAFPSSLTPLKAALGSVGSDEHSEVSPRTDREITEETLSIVRKSETICPSTAATFQASVHTLPSLKILCGPYWMRTGAGSTS